MATRTLVPVEEYLSTVYRPDDHMERNQARMREVSDGVLRLEDPAIEIPLAELFEE